jgi:diguanylate cyclase (GGDEF)-like protein
LVIIVTAHVLLGERGARLFAAMSGLVLAAVFLAETRGLVQVWPAGAGRAWVLLTAQVVFTARLLTLTLRPMRERLADAQRQHGRESARAHELDALLQAQGALLSTLELDPLLRNILDAALAAIPAGEKGTVLLTDASREALQVRAMRGYTDPSIQNLAFVGTRGYSARTLRDRRPWLIDDARADEAIRYDGEVAELRAIQSAISAPLLVEGEPVGVISLDTTRPRAFTAGDLRLLVAFANTAAVAISNASQHANVQALANHDPLTGAANRRMFDATLPTEVARAQRYGHPVSLVFIDLDDFKVYNDSYGHVAGDERLRVVARQIQSLIRNPDMLARYGGEEFALLLPHTDKTGALALAERTRAAAAGQAAAAPGFVPGYTLSVGVATYPTDAPSAEALLRAADEAELAAKRLGKNRVVAARPLTEPVTAEQPARYRGAS